MSHEPPTDVFDPDEFVHECQQQEPLNGLVASAHICLFVSPMHQWSKHTTVIDEKEWLFNVYMCLAKQQMKKGTLNPIKGQHKIMQASRSELHNESVEHSQIPAN